VDTLTSQQSTLDSAVDTLATQQQVLAVQQANMLTTRGGSASGTSTLPAFGAGGVSMGSSVIVPQGFSKAAVTFSVRTYINTTETTPKIAAYDMSAYDGTTTFAFAGS